MKKLLKNLPSPASWANFSDMEVTCGFCGWQYKGFLNELNLYCAAGNFFSLYAVDSHTAINISMDYTRAKGCMLQDGNRKTLHTCGDFV